MWDVTCSKPEASLQFCTRLKAQFHKLSHLCKAQYKKANMSVLYHWFEKWFWRLRAQYCWIYAVAWAITFCCTLCESKSPMACYGHCLAESEFYLKKKTFQQLCVCRASVQLPLHSLETGATPTASASPYLYLLIASLFSPQGALHKYLLGAWLLWVLQWLMLYLNSFPQPFSQPKPGVWMSPW